MCSPVRVLNSCVARSRVFSRFSAWVLRSLGGTVFLMASVFFSFSFFIFSFSCCRFGERELIWFLWQNAASIFQGLGERAGEKTLGIGFTCVSFLFSHVLFAYFLFWTWHYINECLSEIIQAQFEPRFS